MVDMSFDIVALIFTGWLILISFFLIRVYWFFKKLSKDIDKGNLTDVLSKLVSLEENNSKNLRSLSNKLVALEKDGLGHIQKIGIVRFNPFSELGGDNSFCLALLNGKEDGLLVTGLHTRQRTRMYIKHVVAGKSSVKLSKEEEKALEIALK